MKFLFITLLMTTSFAYAGTGPSRWFCSSLIQADGEDVSNTQMVDSDEQMLVAADAAGYALTIEAKADSIELRALQQNPSGAIILQESSASRSTDSSLKIFYPLANGLLSIGCKKVNEEGQSSADRLMIKDAEKYNRSPAVDQLFIKNIMKKSIQE